MPDITMCANKQCPLREKCYRAMAVPNEYWQAWSWFESSVVEGKVECEMFIKLEAVNGQKTHRAGRSKEARS